MRRTTVGGGETLEEEEEEEEGGDPSILTINFNADYASVFPIPRQGAKVCTTDNTAILEMFVVRYCLRRIWIEERRKGGKVIKAHYKNIWQNDIWHFWRPSDGSKGANALNHNHCLDFITKKYKAMFPLKTIRLDGNTDGCRGQSMLEEKFSLKLLHSLNVMVLKFHNQLQQYLVVKVYGMEWGKQLNVKSLMLLKLNIFL